MALTNGYFLNDAVEFLSKWDSTLQQSVLCQHYFCVDQDAHIGLKSHRNKAQIKILKKKNDFEYLLWFLLIESWPCSQYMYAGNSCNCSLVSLVTILSFVTI